MTYPFSEYVKGTGWSAVFPAIIAALFITMLPLSSKAEYLGLVSGREANPGKMTKASIELGFVAGDLGLSDYQNIALRFNYRATPELVVSATAGISEFGVTDGIPLGLGLMYHLSNQRISQKVEIAGKISYHSGDFSVGNSEGDLSSLALEVLVSGAQPLTSNGLAWYSNVGIHRVGVDFGRSDANSEFGLGAGLVLPTGLGEAYVGFDFIDEFTVGLGFRYFISKL